VSSLLAGVDEGQERREGRACRKVRAQGYQGSSGGLQCTCSSGMKAHDLLAPVYGWLNEGFDTPDLIGAKALLDELTSNKQS
jgi:hypothetical protein